MKLEDMKVGVLVKCTKPEWDCYGDIFEITNKLPDNEWEITRRPYWQRRQSGKGIKNLRTTFVIKQKILQHNFKIDKVIEQAHISMLPSKAITINIRFDKTTTAESMGKKVTVGLYHEDKYDEFVGAVEALAKLYDRKSPFDEIEELKEAVRAAAKKTIGRLENSLKKYLKNILKSVDFFQGIWYNIRVERLREKSQSRLNLLIEERERIDPYVHNNPPKILH